MQVYGNWGTLTCDPVTGAVQFYNRADSDWEKPGDGYDIIVAVDIPEWKYRYPHETPDYIDILDIGYWYTKPTGLGYEPPADDWRQLHARQTGLVIHPPKQGNKP